MTIRRATLEDLQAITEIYNDAIINTVATFDTQPKTLEEQGRWFESHDSGHPILVAEEGGNVIGWVCVSEWSDRCAYLDTAELSIYVRRENREKGVGNKLIESILQESKYVGLHTIVARIESSNKVIIHLCEKYGFFHVGVMKEVGYKFGRLLDVVIMQIIL